MRLIDADAFAKKLKEMHGEGGYEADVYCAEYYGSKGNWIWKDPEDYGIQMAEEALEKEPSILEWIEFKLREITEEKEYFSEFDPRFMWDCKLPKDGQYVLISDGSSVWIDLFHDYGVYGCGIEQADLEEGMAWMPLPKPHRKGKENE